MNCGVLCHLAGRQATSKAAQRLRSMRSTISRARAPQAMSSTSPLAVAELEFVGWLDIDEVMTEPVSDTCGAPAREGQRSPAPSWLCLRAMKLLAVSTATAASRQ